MTKEADFEADLKRELESRFPGCFVLKGNSAMRQGVPDRLVLHGRNWAALEVKYPKGKKRNPVFEENQEFYVKKLGNMSYAAVVTPANFHEVIDEMESAFGAEG